MESKYPAMCPATPVTCGVDTASDEKGGRGGEVLQGRLSALPDVCELRQSGTFIRLCYRDSPLVGGWAEDCYMFQMIRAAIKLDHNRMSRKHADRLSDS